MEPASAPVVRLPEWDEETSRPDQAPFRELDAALAGEQYRVVLSADVIARFRTAPHPAAIVRLMSDAILIEAHNRMEEEPEHPLSQALRDEIARRGLDA